MLSSLSSLGLPYLAYSYLLFCRVLSCVVLYCVALRCVVCCVVFIITRCLISFGLAFVLSCLSMSCLVSFCLVMSFLALFCLLISFWLLTEFSLSFCLSLLCAIFTTRLYTGWSCLVLSCLYSSSRNTLLRHRVEKEVRLFLLFAVSNMIT